MPLPVINIADLSALDKNKRIQVGHELRAACLDKGFFYCTGHGIAQGLIDAALEQARLFFSQSLATKQKVDKARSICNRGYEHLGGQTLEANAPPDNKEGFYIGLDLPEVDPRVVAGRFNRGPNLWPQDLPGFKPTMRAYFSAMEVLGERLMDGIALSLKLDENYFSGFKQDPFAILRLLHYPPQTANAQANQKGAGTHTDFGGLTILLQDAVGGLQVFDRSTKTWINAEPVAGSYIVNLGDMIARWTNDQYQSTLHRVINSSGAERYSVPFFYSGNPDHLVSCIPTCLAPGESPNYPPIKVEDHIKSMYEQTYSENS